MEVCSRSDSHFPLWNCASCLGCGPRCVHWPSYACFPIFMFDIAPRQQPSLHIVCGGAITDFVLGFISEESCFQRGTFYLFSCQVIFLVV